jgi:hypothetical protein
VGYGLKSRITSCSLTLQGAGVFIIYIDRTRPFFKEDQTWAIKRSLRIPWFKVISKIKPGE